MKNKTPILSGNLYGNLVAIPNSIPLYEDYKNGVFKKCSDFKIVKETKIFIKNLEGINSILKSDHILNLLPKLEGMFPQDKDKMLNILNDFLNLSSKKQRYYQLGRRLGVFTKVEDLNNPLLLNNVKRYYNELGVNSKNINQITDQLISKYI